MRQNTCPRRGRLLLVRGFTLSFSHGPLLCSLISSQALLQTSSTQPVRTSKDQQPRSPGTPLLGLPPAARVCLSAAPKPQGVRSQRLKSQDLKKRERHSGCPAAPGTCTQGHAKLPNCPSPSRRSSPSSAALEGKPSKKNPFWKSPHLEV